MLRPDSDWHSGLVLLGLLLLASACAPQPLTVTREPATLRLIAADACAPLAEALADAYEASFSWVTVEVEVFNTAVAQRKLQDGEADLALLSWGEGGEGLWIRPFAGDGIAVIVHPDMPFTEIRLANLQEIYQGRVQEWGELVLSVVSREDGSGTRAAFEAAVLGAYETTRTAVVMSSDQAVVEYVGATPGSIGYVSTLTLDGSEGVRVLPVEGVSPSPETLADGRYLLSRSLYVATVGEPTGEARSFAQWLLGPAGQAVAGR